MKKPRSLYDNSQSPHTACEARALCAEHARKVRDPAGKSLGMLHSMATKPGCHLLVKARGSIPRGIASKLDQTRGDSFAEAMVAFLVAALGTVLLATMIITASNVIGHNKETIARVYEAEVAIAEGDPIPGGQEATINGTELGGTYRTPIDVYEDGGLARYRATGTEGAL